MRGLAAEFYPQAVEISLPCSESQIAHVERELVAKAEVDGDKCWGYFPALADKVTIDAELPLCREFAGAVPELVVQGRKLNFNFLRLSLIQQSSEAPYHLDSDAATALTGDTSTIAGRLVWRLLLNLSSHHDRTLSYLDIDPFSVGLSSKGGYTNCPPEHATPEVVREVVLPPRRSNDVNGVLFCSSRVLHTGQDDEYGHFVSGYGYEKT